jgi:hypothetical protein
VGASWWTLPGEAPTDAEAGLSLLGVSTGLAGAEPQGAVVGTTAVLDGSYLSPQEAYATPLFAEVAHQFTVRVYRGRGYRDHTLAAVRGLLDREAPAHTSGHVCVVEPRMRVGVQARVGVDAVVAGPEASTAMRAEAAGGLVLGGPPSGRLGRDSYLGRTSLTDTPTRP